jgi:hypothetical protein
VVQLVLKSLVHQTRSEQNRDVSHAESAMLFPEINLGVLSLDAQETKSLTVVAPVRAVVHTLLLGIFQVAVEFVRDQLVLQIKY